MSRAKLSANNRSTYMSIPSGDVPTVQIPVAAATNEDHSILSAKSRLSILALIGLVVSSVVVVTMFYHKGNGSRLRSVNPSSKPLYKSPVNLFIDDSKYYYYSVKSLNEFGTRDEISVHKIAEEFSRYVEVTERVARIAQQQLAETTKREEDISASTDATNNKDKVTLKDGTSETVSQEMALTYLSRLEQEVTIHRQEAYKFTENDEETIKTSVDYGDNAFVMLQKCVNIQFQDEPVTLVLSSVFHSTNDPLFANFIGKVIDLDYHYDSSFFELEMSLHPEDVTIEMKPQSEALPWIYVNERYDKFMDIYMFNRLNDKHDHMLTTNPLEHYQWFSYAGVLFQAPDYAIDDNWVPLYKFFARGKADHYYSINLAANQPSDYDHGILCFVRKTDDPSDPDLIPIYESYDHPWHDHIYTAGKKGETGGAFYAYRPGTSS